MTASLLLALFFAALLVWSARTLAGLHPIKLWAASWTVATSAYVLHLLPYRWLEWTTVLVIAGATVAFSGGVLIAERGCRTARIRPSHVLRDSQLDPTRWAAGLGFVVTVALASAFVAEIATTLGWQAVLRPPIDIETAIAEGTAPSTSTYTYFAIAAATLCALASSQARLPAEARTWLAAAAIVVSSLYFAAPGRMLMVVAALSAIVVIVNGPARQSTRRMGFLHRGPVVAAIVGAGVVALFIVGSEVSGKTLDRTDQVELGTFRNVFGDHDALAWAGLPYQNITASLPALDRQIAVTTVWGKSHGCGLLALGCRMLGKTGLPLRDEPARRPFTPPPLRWNTYTFLETPLLDGGLALVLLIMGVMGIAFGVIWWAAARGIAIGRLAYGFAACAMLFAGRQNLVAQLALPAAVTCALLISGHGCARSAAVMNRIRGTSDVAA